MNRQLPLVLEDTAASSLEIRARNRAADDKAERIRGIELCVRAYREALRLNTYPHVGRGDPLLPEHRPYLEADVTRWETELGALRAA